MTLPVATIQDVAPPPAAKPPSRGAEFARLLGAAPAGRAASQPGQHSEAPPANGSIVCPDDGPDMPALDVETAVPGTAQPKEVPQGTSHPPARHPSDKAGEDRRPAGRGTVDGGPVALPTAMPPNGASPAAVAPPVARMAPRVTSSAGVSVSDRASASKPGGMHGADGPSEARDGGGQAKSAALAGRAEPAGFQLEAAGGSQDLSTGPEDVADPAGVAQPLPAASGPPRPARRTGSAADTFVQASPAPPMADATGAPPTEPMSVPVPAPGSATPVAAETPAGAVSEAGSVGSRAPPTAQIGRALATLHTGPDGGSRLTVQLDPVELGQVRIHITRGHDGSAAVSVAVERPETLRGLQADLPHLHQVLDRAGLPEHRSVSLHLAAADTSASAGGQPATHGGGAQQQAAGGGGGQGRGHPAQPPRQSHGPTSTQDADPSPGGQAGRRWVRAGVDITA